MKKWFVLCLLLIFPNPGNVLLGQTPSELLDDFEQTEELVFKLKNHGDYDKAFLTLTEGFLHLTRMLTATPEGLYAELAARGECYLELLYSLAQRTAKYSELEEALSKVQCEAADLSALMTHIRALLNLHLGRIDEARTLQNSLGTIESWYLIGPFDNERGGGFDTAYGPEENLDLDAVYDGKERPVSWRLNPRSPVAGIIDLNALMNPDDQCLAYALAFIDSVEEQEVCLRLGSDEAIKVYLNGQPVYALDVRRLHHFDQDVIGLRLQAGVNTIMLKVCDQTGPWSFSARLTAPSGGPVEGIKILADADDLTLPSADETAGAPEADAAAFEALAGAKSHFEARAAEGEARANLYLGYLHLVREYEGEARGLAKKHFEAFLAENPDHVYGTYLKAESELRRIDIAAEKDINQWREDLERVLELDPQNVEAHVELGRHYLTSLPIPDLALQHAQTAFEINPDFLPTSYLFADIYDVKNMYARSRKAITRLSHDKNNMGYPGLLNRLGKLAQSDRRPAQARSYWLAAVEANFLAYDARGRLLDMALDTGDIAEARRLLLEELALNPYNTDSLKMLATLALGDENNEEAISRLEEVLEINPLDDGALKSLGDVHHAAGNGDEALGFFKRALEINPKSKELQRYVEFLYEGERPFEDDFKVDVLALTASHPHSENPENDSHEYLLIQNVIRVNVDGTSAHYHHRIMRILNQEGAKNFDYFSTWYDPHEQNCRFLTARVIHPDGSIEEAKIDNSNRTAPKGREMIPAFVDLPPLKIGDLVDVEYRTDDLKQSFFGDYFGHRQYFQPRDLKRVYDSRLSLILPVQRTFQFNQQNMEMQPEVTRDEAKGIEIRTWTLSDLLKIDPERQMPGRVEKCPYVEITSYSDWDEFGSWWWNLVEEQLDINDEMKQKVAELTEGAETEFDKVKAIYNFVVSDIRYNDTWEFGIHGFKPYKCSAIYANRFGDCKDKSILMKALLKGAGIDSFPVLIRLQNVRSEEDLTLPLVSHFNHVISYVPMIDGEQADLFLDGTAQYHPMEALPDGDRGAKVFVVQHGPGKIMTIPYPEASANMQTIAFEANLRADGGAEVNLDASFQGTYEPMIRKRFLNPGKRKDNLEKTFGSLFGDVAVGEFEFTDVEDLNVPVRYDARIEVKKLLSERVGGLQMPSVFFPSEMGRLAVDEDRQFDLLMGAPNRVSSAVVYRLPDGFSVEVLPQDTVLENDFAAYSLTYERGENNTIQVRRDFTIKVPRIAVENYPAFRDLCRKAERAEDKMILITK